MKLAITADLHLTSLADHPERFHALEGIFDQMLQRDIRTLIIAGDLFNETSSNYADFETILKQPKYVNLEIYIIPGNHDPSIKRTQFALAEQSQIFIFSTPEVIQPDPSGPYFLFLPFIKNRTMGEIIANHTNKLSVNNWVLVAHGDWLEGINVPNPVEDGTYMPLTRRDLDLFHPAKVFLGHIHLPWEREPVHYPGSPCGLDITESGLRSFLIYDTTSGNVERVLLETDYIFCDASLIVLPLPDELDRVRAQIAEILNSLDKIDRNKINIRLKIRGGSANKKELAKTVEQALDGCVFYEGISPDLSEVEIAENSDVATLAQKVTEQINALSLDLGEDGPSREEILTAAFHLIYGGKRVN